MLRPGRSTRALAHGSIACSDPIVSTPLHNMTSRSFRLRSQSRFRPYSHHNRQTSAEGLEEASYGVHKPQAWCLSSSAPQEPPPIPAQIARKKTKVEKFSHHSPRHCLAQIPPRAHERLFFLFSAHTCLLARYPEGAPPSLSNFASSALEELLLPCLDICLASSSATPVGRAVSSLLPYMLHTMSFPPRI